MADPKPTWLEQQMTKILQTSLEEGNRDRKEFGKNQLALLAAVQKLSTSVEEHDKSAERRHKAYMEANAGLVRALQDDRESREAAHAAVVEAQAKLLRAVKSDDDHKTGYHRVLGRLISDPVVKHSIVSLMLAAAGYLTFRLTGIPVTPNPVQVSQPVEVVEGAP